jgi:hypothetical protein
MSELTGDIERDLASLADGSLAPEHRGQLLELVRESPELQDALAEQRRVIELMGAVDVAAPASLHSQVERTIARRRRRSAFAIPRVGFAAATMTVVVVAVAVAIGLTGGSSTGLSVQQAAAVTLGRATMGAPAESDVHRAELSASVDGVSFPYWQDRFGWRSAGAREDRLAGRAVTTVFYANAEGLRIGYAIVSGSAPATHGGKVVWRGATPYRVTTHDGATVITWERGGHLCIVAGRGVGAQTLLDLAGWTGEQPRAA